MHRCGKESPQTRSPHRLAAHGLRVIGECAADLILYNKTFDRSRTSNALVKVAGNDGVLLTDFPVDTGELGLEQREEQHRQRQYSQHQQGKTCVDDKHDHDCTDQITQLPNTVQQCPGDKRADAGGIAHYAGVDPAHTVLVKIGKGEGLQVGEGGVAQIFINADFDGHALVGRRVIQEGCRDDHRKIYNNKDGQSVQRTAAHKMIEGISLKDRHTDVNTASHQTAQDHDGKGALVVFKIGEDLSDAEKGKVFRARLLHETASSAPDWIAQIR